MPPRMRMYCAGLCVAIAMRLTELLPDVELTPLAPGWHDVRSRPPPVDWLALKHATIDSVVAPHEVVLTVEDASGPDDALGPVPVEAPAGVKCARARWRQPRA